MATQKKGCGFLIAALLLFIVGVVGAIALVASAAKDLAGAGGNLADSQAFITPATGTYTGSADQEVNLFSDVVASEGAVFTVTETESNQSVKFTKPSGSLTIGNSNLLGSFQAKKDVNYTITTEGLPDNTSILMSSATLDDLKSTATKGVGAFALGGICGFVALILGIIGLVKFFGSKKEAPPAAG